MIDHPCDCATDVRVGSPGPGLQLGELPCGQPDTDVSPRWIARGHRRVVRGDSCYRALSAHSNPEGEAPAASLPPAHSGVGAASPGVTSEAAPLWPWSADQLPGRTPAEATLLDSAAMCRAIAMTASALCVRRWRAAMAASCIRIDRGRSISKRTMSVSESMVGTLP